MTIRLIDNKRIELTATEFEVYQDVCKSYDRPNFQGKDLFSGLFETNENGIIVFLRPPSKKFVSMEVLTFLQNIMVHQHLRLMYDEIDTTRKSLKKEVSGLIDEIKQLKDKIDKING